jgi:hypothetical protein
MYQERSSSTSRCWDWTQLSPVCPISSVQFSIRLSLIIPNPYSPIKAVTIDISLLVIPSHDFCYWRCILCANMLAVCARIQALLEELKETLQRKEAVVWLQVVRRQARAAWASPLPATTAVAVEQQPQNSVYVDQLECNPTATAAGSISVQLRGRLSTSLHQLPVSTNMVSPLTGLPAMSPPLLPLWPRCKLCHVQWC